MYTLAFTEEVSQDFASYIIEAFSKLEAIFSLTEYDVNTCPQKLEDKYSY